MVQRYIPRCQYCGKSGAVRIGSSSGAAPTATPIVAGKCPCHPSGKPNMPHSPKWEKA